jgi:phosphotransferase system HPr (HPr) family protein
MQSDCGEDSRGDQKPARFESARQLDARPDGRQVRYADYDRVKIQVSAKSVMELIMLEAGQGSKLKLRAEGNDAIDAVAAIQALFEKRFGQE